jgi:hypothetical protein
MRNALPKSSNLNTYAFSKERAERYFGVMVYRLRMTEGN